MRTVQADARLAGLDAQAEWRATPWLDLGARASLLRADNLTLDGPLHGVPSSRRSARVRIHGARLAGLGAPFVEADVQHVARQAADEAEAILEEAAPVTEVAPPPPAVKPRFRDRLGKARSLFSGYVGSVLSRSTIDDETWDELEEALIRADVGAAATSLFSCS